MKALDWVRFGTGVDASVREALAADPGFVHPEYASHPAWVLRDGTPQVARIVEVERVSAADPTATRFAVLAQDVVIMHGTEQVFWSKDDAARAQAALDETFDL